ncbi:MAG: DUF523 domain-containing protein [Candidatus Binataceae bacterium]|jgi:uncharacterized protein YbbK (DUF523 family)
MSEKSRPEQGAVIVSACLLGRRCRFDGRDKLTPELGVVLEGRSVIAVCPEEMGGLGTPRPSCQLRGGDGGGVLDGDATVVDANSVNRSVEFVKGAEAALAEAIAGGATDAVLKDNSPSCGVHNVYRDGTLLPGEGVFTALLRRRGIAIYDENVTKLRSKRRPKP